MREVNRRVLLRIEDRYLEHLKRKETQLELKSESNVCTYA